MKATGIRTKGLGDRCTTWVGTEPARRSDCSIKSAASPLPFLTGLDQVLLYKGHLVAPSLCNAEAMKRKNQMVTAICCLE